MAPAPERICPSGHFRHAAAQRGRRSSDGTFGRRLSPAFCLGWNRMWGGVCMSQPVMVTPESPAALINRELSWLSFARRVLALAEDPEQPLLERVKFAGIMGMIYDEFAMKRIGGLFRKATTKEDAAGPVG